MTRQTMKVAAVQFEMAQNDVPNNLATMSRFVDEAKRENVDVIVFPELCTAGYHFLTTLGKPELLALAENVEQGPTVRFFTQKAKQTGMTILFGLLERGEGDAMFNTFVVVTPDGPIFKHRKVHAFENSAIRQGDQLETFELLGWRCGILISYDSNIPENTRVLALKGAEREQAAEVDTRTIRNRLSGEKIR